MLVDAVTQVERQMQIDIKEARDVLGSLDIAAHPKHGVSNTAQHGGKLESDAIQLNKLDHG